MARAIRALALGAWFGGIVMTFVTAQTVFGADLGLPRKASGQIVFAILQHGAIVRTALGLAALLCEAIVFFSRNPLRPQGWRRYLPAVLLLGAITLSMIVAFWVQPQMLEYQSKISDYTSATASDPNRIKFGQLHGLSMGMFLLEGIFVGLAVLLGLL